MNTMPASNRKGAENLDQAPVSGRHMLRDHLTHFRNVMLVTFAKGDPQRLHARPMAIARFDDEAPIVTVWFVAHVESAKVAEARSPLGAYVIGQSASRFLFIGGNADVVRDRQRIESMWNKSFDLWFPDGPGDPNVCLIAFYPEQAEAWDVSGTKGLGYLLESAKALVRGNPRDTSGSYAKIDLQK
jgi:general stress protein 26